MGLLALTAQVAAHLLAAALAAGLGLPRWLEQQTQAAVAGVITKVAAVLLAVLALSSFDTGSHNATLQT